MITVIKRLYGKWRWTNFQYIKTITMSEARVCGNCGKVLRGRIDKKFCDDHCRNHYNNQRSPDNYQLVRKVNYALTRNRKILAELLPKGARKARIPRSTLLERGFQFRFTTHTIGHPKEGEYRFCYDMGYLSLDNEQLLLVRKDQLPEH